MSKLWADAVHFTPSQMEPSAAKYDFHSDVICMSCSQWMNCLMNESTEASSWNSSTDPEQGSSKCTNFSIIFVLLRSYKQLLASYKDSKWCWGRFRCKCKSPWQSIWLSWDKASSPPIIPSHGFMNEVVITGNTNFQVVCERNLTLGAEKNATVLWSTNNENIRLQERFITKKS